jgi:glycosyltransferase involved in cell wall biosynthesis
MLPDQELSKCLKASHVLVMPSSYEGYGIAYAEAMGFGLPAIGTTAGAAGEIITHGRDGFLISPGDTVALASYLTKLAQNRPRLLEMSVAARDRYRSLPTWKGSMDAIRTFLIELVGDAAF